MQSIQALILILFVSPVWASPFQTAKTTCGDYVARGVLAINSGVPNLILLRGSISETKLKLSGKNLLAKIERYKGAGVEIEGRLKKPLAAYRGNFEVQNVRPILLDPINPESDQKLTLREKKQCDR